MTSVWSSRAIIKEEEGTGWICTADVIKPVHADWLADFGMPTGIYCKRLYDNGYECFSRPLQIKRNIIRFRVAGDRDSVTYEHQLTLTVNNHDTLQEAKHVFLEKVEVIYKQINWGLDMEPLL